MGVLSGPRIAELVRTAQRLDGKPVLPFLDIDPFVPENVQPNSYDLTLGPTIRWHETSGEPLDPRVAIPTGETRIPPSGLVLARGRLYLGSTVERTECHGLVPVLNGRSSMGRLGLSVHVTAGFGDDGFSGQWTLELTAVEPVRVFAGMRIAQVAFFTLDGPRRPYAGRYQGQVGPVASRLWADTGEGR